MALSKNNKKPVVLVLGVTGQLGKLVADHLKDSEDIVLKVTSRKTDLLSKLEKEYNHAVYLDLDDPRTFSDALKGVDRLFLLTGYTVNMLVQSKAIVDAAKKSGVSHIVHLGVFTPQPDCYDPHFAWHQMIEAYIKNSGIPYTFLHPNCFMQNFTGFYGLAKNGKIRFYINHKKVGWIALEDVAEASAKILTEGPSKHKNKDYWFSTESLNIQEVAQIFTEVTGHKFVAESLSPERFLTDFSSEQEGPMDPYFVGVAEFFKQVVDGRMAYIADVRDDLPQLIGRKGTSLKEWAKLHHKELSKLAGKETAGVR
jgi:NAD(P)H dehydrogenase (quinone)